MRGLVPFVNLCVSAAAHRACLSSPCVVAHWGRATAKEDHRDDRLDEEYGRW